MPHSKDIKHDAQCDSACAIPMPRRSTSRRLSLQASWQGLLAGENSNTIGQQAVSGPTWAPRAWIRFRSCCRSAGCGWSPFTLEVRREQLIYLLRESSADTWLLLPSNPHNTPAIELTLRAETPSTYIRNIASTSAFSLRW